LGEKVLDNTPPPPPGENTNKTPDKFKPKPPAEKDPINDIVKQKENEAWRKQNLERMKRMAGSENVLNRLNQ
jgi:hypothetical protein